MTPQDSTYDDQNSAFPGDGGGNQINDGAGLEIADPNDFFHRRDGDDNLQPVVQQIPGREQAFRVIPPTSGDFRKYSLDDPDALYEDDALFAEFLNEFFPDLNRVSEQDVADGMIPYGAEVFVDMVQRAGGKDMKEAMDGREMKRMMEMFGDGEGNMDFQKLVEAGQQMEDEDEA